MRKDIRYESRGFALTLVDYTSKMVTLSRSGNMFNNVDTVHLDRAGPGK